ncbi:RNA 2',3'-cyclic phosphodiesterase [Aureibacillus halotolerans]|uniref:RNA 2',3'-cyclic phosphodiesterase n=1 Tax=Aureibacillus halotolerans TaxID=1508390 RepID=A0A4R6U1C5_9BACI|nr:RNA 2',3'-cyclic phosphodiesterase [Aureibacillus halotolerans]TDQ39062.1 2'-5' RNA ligase [Aureibacillus halotolerans]
MAAHYFIGAKIPTSFYEPLRSLQQHLASHAVMKQWTHEEDFHLTFAFLGSVSLEKLDEINDALLSVSQLNSSVCMHWTTIASFGKEKQPRVVYAGVEKTGPLLRLHAAIEKALQKTGRTPEKRTFTPHVTLAKRWADQTQQVESDFLGKPIHLPSWSLEKITIFEIKPLFLPKYHVLNDLPLQKIGTSYEMLNRE